MEAAEQPAAETLLEAFTTIEASERIKHETVLNYWLSIRGNRELPPLRDLDPLEISEAGPSSVLLELVGGGEDAEIRHLGERLKGGSAVERVADAPRASILSCIAKRLSIVAVSQNFLAFEDEFSSAGARTRCWVTLLPLSSAGAWVDYVYAFVTFEAGSADAEQAAEVVADDVEPTAEPAAEVDESAVIPAVDVLELTEPADEPEQPAAENPDEPPAADEPEQQPSDESSDEPPAAEDPAEEAPRKIAGFSFDNMAAAAGFYGTQGVKVEPSVGTARPVAGKAKPAVVEPAPVADVAAAPLPDDQAAPAPSETAAPSAKAEPNTSHSASEGPLHSKLAEVRAKADAARMAKLKSNAALYEGLSAAYDFALDAEESAEEYLKLVEAQGLKIQLRSPMTPVVKLAFDGMCDDSTLGQLEAVLAWALKQDLPRGTLAQRLEEEGGIAPILNGKARAA